MIGEGGDVVVVSLRVRTEAVVDAAEIDLDDDALHEAMRLLGTKTKSETVNEALRAVVRWRKQATEAGSGVPAGE